MGDSVSNARTKLDEAKFYLDLMDKIELDRTPFTQDRTPDVEFSYLLSAFLGACYSSIEHLSRQKENEKATVDFKKNNPAFYKSGSEGGWRTQAVHFRPISPQHDGYIPPPGNNVTMRFREKAQSTTSGRNISLSFGPGRFYFTAIGPQDSICNVCARHLTQVDQLINSCAQRLST